MRFVLLKKELSDDKANFLIEKIAESSKNHISLHKAVRWLVVSRFVLFVQ